MAKGVRVVTPIVELMFPNIDREDFKYKNYGTGWRIAKDHALVGQIEQFIDDNFTKGDLKHAKFSRGYKVDPDNADLVTMTAKSKSQQQVVDVRGRPIAPPPVGGGTKARISISIDKSKGDNPGVVLRYNGVQIITLVERGGAFGDMSGEVEDGYEGDDEQLSAGKGIEQARRASMHTTEKADGGTEAVPAGSTDF